MAFRRFLRGTVPWPTLEGAVREVMDRYDLEAARVVFLDADNWLSTPCVVNDELFVKVVTEQNSLVHALLTAGRNLGAFSSGTEGFFERFDAPIEMAEHELEANERMREIGVSAPEPKEAFEYDDVAVMVLEYLPDFRSLDELPPDEVRGHAVELFEALERMHDNNLAHGDLQRENVLVSGGELYFIDATKVREGAIEDARAYDTACALGALEPLVGARDAVAAALEVHDTDELMAAREFLDFVNIRPEHDFDGAAVKGEIEKHAA
ncbi:RIO1 family regulatory kinase/ATPase domain-containing protein [Halosimplex halobium]|uniref:RIO1 family regulatory kinase/ATPase domain-containing protein n=1 Tax=Halosimplex halobium TaxID=3396618 RepID=UPI003F56AEDB